MRSLMLLQVERAGMRAVTILALECFARLVRVAGLESLGLNAEIASRLGLHDEWKIAFGVAGANVVLRDEEQGEKEGGSDEDSAEIARGGWEKSRIRRDANSWGANTRACWENLIYNTNRQLGENKERVVPGWG